MSPKYSKPSLSGRRFAAVSSAVMALPGISEIAKATTIEPGVSFSYRYSDYSEDELAASDAFDPPADGSGVDRYSIDIHQAKLRAAIGSKYEVTLKGLTETMSGASPWYVRPGDNNEPVQVMSSASQSSEFLEANPGYDSIEDSRTDIGISLRSVGDSSEYTVGYANSSEDDYVANSINGSYTKYTNQNNTSYTIGGSFSADKIDATDADQFAGRPTDESKNMGSIFLGFSQNFSKNLLFGASYTFARYDGYLTDAYKQVFVDGIVQHESRPDTRNQSAWGIKFRQFHPSLNAAAHTNYRYYQNSWGVKSHTIDFSWYQSLGWGFQIVPGARFYTQTDAKFYEPFFADIRSDGNYSSDYRLSDHTAISYSLKLSKQIKRHALHVSFERYESKSNEDNRNPGLVDFTHASVGFDLNF